MQMKWLLMMGVCLWGGANVWAQCTVTAAVASIKADGSVADTHIAPSCTSFTLKFASDPASPPPSWLAYFPIGKSPCNVSGGPAFVSSPAGFATCVINATTLASSMTNCHLTGERYCFDYTVVVFPSSGPETAKDPKVIVDSTGPTHHWWRFFWPF